MKTVIKFLTRQILLINETLQNAEKLDFTESMIHEQKLRLKEFNRAKTILSKYKTK